MKSFLRPVRGRKARRRVVVETVSREEFEGMDLDARIEMIKGLLPLGLMHIEELLKDEVESLAEGRYTRKSEDAAGRRYGSNPGSIRLGGQRIPIQVPRIRSERGEIPLRTYSAMKGRGEVDETLLRRVLYGISCRNYEAAAAAIPGAFGLSSSSVSRSFVDASAAKLKEFQERDLSQDDIVAMFLDGKSFADEVMMIALGITMEGEKRVLGFVQTDTENERVLSTFLRSLLDRGLDISEGILVIQDGGKGLRSAVRKAFRGRAVVQRCLWHKRENVVSYLSRNEQVIWRRRLQRAYERPTYKEAMAALKLLLKELELKNQSAAASLAEGLEETLTLHRLGVFATLGRSFKTTNCLESINAQIEERCAKVDVWKNSNQRNRWLAIALLDIEPRLRKVMGHHHLGTLRAAIKSDLKIGKMSDEKAA